MNDRNTTIAQLRQRVAGFVADRKWQKYHRPKNLVMSLAVEAAELMEHFQWLDHDEGDALKRNPRARAEVADEMADVLAFLLSLANAMAVDLSAAFEAKMAKNDRKYPAAKVRPRGRPYGRGHYRRPKGDS